jgi:tyrosine-protein phosphatase YwqE
MVQLGEKLHRDYLLLTPTQLNSGQLGKLLFNYTEYLISQNFKEYRLLVPHSTSTSIVKSLNEFLNSTTIQGKLIYYFDQLSRNTIKDNYSILDSISFEDYIFVKPSFDFKYDYIKKQIWELAQKGKNLMIIMPESVKELHNNFKIINHLNYKGVALGFSGSYEFRLGIWHKKNLKQFQKNRLINIWITNNFISKDDSKMKKDINCKIDVLNEFPQLILDL